MDRGKRFEYNFHKSLKRLPGASMRILDGGRSSQLRVWGDFLFWGADEGTWLFECKSTHLKSFRLEQVKRHQLESLADFELLREDTHSFLAINFYSEEDKTGRMWLVPILEYLRLIDETVNTMGRESIPLAIFEDRLREAARLPGSMWDLGFLVPERI